MSWFDGRTDNVSKSGLLFLPDHALEPKTSIEGRLVLPVVIAGQPPAEVVFRGVVVRTVPRAGANARPALAVAMEEYRITRGDNSSDNCERPIVGGFPGFAERVRGAFGARSVARPSAQRRGPAERKP